MNLRHFGIIFLLLILFFLLSPQSTLAFYTRGIYQFQFWQAVYGTEEINLQSFVYETLKSIIASLADILIPFSPENKVAISNAVVSILSSSSSPASPFASLQNNSGVIGTMSLLLATPYGWRPASGKQYLAELASRLNFAQPTYAQEKGMGWERMAARGLLVIWRSFRNIAYVFLALAFVFIGFAIMFRVKINPQTVITLQSALPRLILILLLITFSYAIVGFLIDLMFVGFNLLLFTFKQICDQARLTMPFLTDTVVLTDEGIAWRMFLTGLIPSFITIIMTIPLFIIIIASSLTLPIIGPIIGPPTASMVIGLLLLIILIVLFIALLRAFLSLIKAYMNVVLSLILAPFQILMGVFPGSRAIQNWFIGLIANLATLPAIMGMVLLSAYLSLLTTVGGILGSGSLDFSGSFFENIRDNFKPGNDIILISLSIGFLLMTPKAGEMIRALIAGQPFAYGAAIAAPIATGLGGVLFLPREAFGVITGGIKEKGVKTIAGLSGQEMLGLGEAFRKNVWKGIQEFRKKMKGGST